MPNNWEHINLIKNGKMKVIFKSLAMGGLGNSYWTRDPDPSGYQSLKKNLPNVSYVINFVQDLSLRCPSFVTIVIMAMRNVKGGGGGKREREMKILRTCNSISQSSSTPNPVCRD